MDKETQAIISKTLAEIKVVEEKFSKIQKNPALYGAENGLSTHELETLEKLNRQLDVANIAADAIIKRFSA